MKKVLTLTFHLANNYGAMLQTYALQKILQEKYETKIINYDCAEVFNDYKLIKISKNYKQFIFSFVKIPFYYKRYKNFAKFRKKLVFTQKYKTINKLKKQPPYADAYIVGSDQLWNIKITKGFNDAYFLDFGNENIKKIAYAISCGDNQVILNNLEYFRKKLKNFTAISVREKNIEKPVQHLFKEEVTTVLDPSLLLTKEQWLASITNKKIINEKFIFAYSVGNQNDLYYDAINELARKTGYLIVFFDRKNIGNKIKYKNKSYYSCGPDQFVNLLNAAEYVITTSFHGLAFSILFNKKFVVTLSTYPERLLTLIQSLDMQNHIIKNTNKIVEILEQKTDWKLINNKLKQARYDSKKWLFSNIENNKKEVKHE